MSLFGTFWHDLALFFAVFGRAPGNGRREKRLTTGYGQRDHGRRGRDRSGAGQAVYVKKQLTRHTLAR